MSARNLNPEILTHPTASADRAFRTRSYASLLLLLSLAAIGAACARRSPALRRPHLLVVTIDTLRADHCSAYGYARATTPTLDRLARAGVLCRTAYAPMATTTPSHATMFTGLLPREHGLVKNGQALSAGRLLLAERLHAEGYRTAAFVSSFPLDRRFGLGRGFTSYDDDFGSAPDAGPPPPDAPPWEGHHVPGAFERTAEKTRGRAVEWLRSQGYLDRPGAPPPEPFFLWVHFFDPHFPYAPPRAHAALLPSRGPTPTELERQTAAYDGEIHFADAELGVLIDEMDRSGLTANTLVVVAGDHGEGLMEHGHMNHGVFIYEEAVRVPLVFSWPAGLPSARTIDAPVQLLDLSPTVLELLGRPPATSGPARSLARVLKGEEAPDASRDVLLQRRHYDVAQVGAFVVKGEKAAVRAGAWKYIEAKEEGTYELYDLARDPHEMHNLYRPDAAEAARLALKLDAWRRSVPAASVPPVSEEDARRLRSLGYVQ